MNKFILAIALIAGLATTAGAKTLHYTFDVTETDIFFDGLRQPYDPLYTPDPEDVRALHVLGGVMGQTGPVALRISYPNSPEPHYNPGRITCLSGFLCNNGAFVVQAQDKVYKSVWNSDTNWDFHMIDGMEWRGTFDDLGDGTLFFYDDYNVSDYVWLNEELYAFTGAKARLTLSDVSVEIHSTPLPASALIYGVVLLPFLYLRRRHT